jgi:peptidoglycan/LPS O-acetylase OafA/YrhL
MSLSFTTPTEKSAAVSGRILQLDGLRAVAILLVLVEHTIHVPLTWAGVDIFFVLSGFLITGILLARKREGNAYFSYFYRRRVFRILPPYIVTLLLFGLIFGWNAFHPWPTMLFFGMNLQPFFTSNHMPLPLWSLAVEEQFYLVWPFIILLVSERTLMRLAIAAIVITPILRALCTPLFPDELYIYMLTPFRADLLCAGAILALVWKDRTPRTEDLFRRRAWIVFAFALCALLLSQHWSIFRLWSNTRYSNSIVYLLTLIAAASLLAWTLADRSWLHRILTFRPMRYIGEVSYTVYLIHIMFALLLRTRVHSPIEMFFLVTLLSILWASISWFLMERPLIRFAARGSRPQYKAKAA